MFRRPSAQDSAQPPGIAGLTLNRLVPNMLTVSALCMGLTAIRYAVEGLWKHAVVCILLAGVLDGLDGRVARLLHGTSRFGAELDSLSDFVCFGVAPALLLYLWGVNHAGVLGWAVALLFTVCCALRLARFNTMIGEEKPSYAGHFFVGTPAPASAGLAMLPIVLDFEIPTGLFSHPLVAAGVLLFVSVLMVSNLPTFSFKKFRIPPKWVLPLLLVVGILAAFLLYEPWWSLSCLAISYLASFPFSIHAYHRFKKSAEGGESARGKR